MFVEWEARLASLAGPILAAHLLRHIRPNSAGGVRAPRPSLQLFNHFIHTQDSKTWSFIETATSECYEAEFT